MGVASQAVKNAHPEIWRGLLLKNYPQGVNPKLRLFFLLQLLLNVHFVDKNGLETVGIGDRGYLRADARNRPGSSRHLP